MKLPMYRKETSNQKYREDPLRAVNFKVGQDGSLVCPNNRRFRFFARKQ